MQKYPQRKIVEKLKICIMDSATDCNSPVEEQPEVVSETDESIRPNLAQFKKSWGFRRSTIAKREFMEEVGELAISPPLVRKGRGRRSKTPSQQTTPVALDNQKATCSAKSVLDGLEWSAPSSPATEESKTNEASTEGSMDPSTWQNFGSAFHKAFSLLGGSDGSLIDLVVTPNIVEESDDSEAPLPQLLDDNELPFQLIDDSDALKLPLEAKDQDDVVSISSREDECDEMALLDVKQKQDHFQIQENLKGTKGGKGKGRGRGKPAEVLVDTANYNELPIGKLPEQPLLLVEEELNMINPLVPKEMEQMCLDLTLSPPHQSDSIAIEGDKDQPAAVTMGQFENAAEDDREESVGDYLNMTNPDAMCLICQQKHNNRYMVCCNSCQGWFHGDCVGYMKKDGTEYICLVCTTKEQTQLEADLTIEPELDMSPLKRLMQSPPAEHSEDVKKQQTQNTLEIIKVEENPSLTVEAESATVSQTSSPVCIGPDCGKAALPGSVYCGSDCIMQHAAATIKNLTVPKPPKTRGRPQRKAAPARAPAKVQKGSRASKRLADRCETLEQKEEEDGQESESSQTCDPSLTEAQATQCNASAEEDPGVAADVIEAVAPLETSEEAASPTPDIPTPAPPPEEIAPSPERIPEPAVSQNSPKKPTAPIPCNASKQSSKESNTSNTNVPPPATTPKPILSSQATTKSMKSTEGQSQTPLINRLHETGAIMAKKTTFVIPKKTPAAPQPQPNQASSPTSSSTPPQKLPPVPVVQTETRNLPVPPAPSAPSSRPSQPNNQVRQSIQRSLVGILYKRVCDSEKLEMSESDVGKLVTNIEMEMFNIFRNTDSKYMNKYRTIMFNLKDPKHKGLLYRLVQGEISPFRLVRMSQKDMQAIQPPEPSPKEIKSTPSVGASLLQKPEPVKLDLPSLIQKRTDKTKNVPLLEQKKSVHLPGGNSLQKPEPPKLDLPSLIQTRTDKTKNVPAQEQKKNVPDPILKTRSSQRGGTVPDILTCMLKDTTAEHHKHLFDVKCKICTGQMPPDEMEEPAQKKKRVSEDKRETSWKSSRGDDSPLQAPPDSPELDSPVPQFTMGSPVLTIVEPPASPPTQDSPSSPPMDTPASPVMESPASPTSDETQSAQMKTYTPVVIPAVSTVTITRRDPRTAASRYAALTNSSAALTEREPQKSDSYFPSPALPSVPPVSLPSAPILPKSILMKPSHSTDPRLYGSSLRNSSPKIPSEGGTAQFLSKQDILWKGFLNMLTIAKFVTKGYLVSGSAEPLKADLPDTIQIGGRILPKTVWDYVAKLKTSVTKELCVIRFQPATDEEEVAYVSLFSYFSSRGRFGVVANCNRSIKDMYLVPLSAKEAVPTILQPLEGPGFETNRPNLLLGLAITQKTKRPGSSLGEVEEKRSKVSMSSDPLWIPKPPSLYGSNKVDDFQPYDPETPFAVTPPGSPPRSAVSSTPSVPPTSIASTSLFKTNKESMPAKTDTTKSSNETPLQTILKQLFPITQKESDVSSETSSTKAASSKKCSVSMVDPIVQQYGGKNTIDEMEEDDNDLDRPYDPEEEYDPAGGYGMVIPKSNADIKEDIPQFPENIHDDVAYDPEDETIFEDIRNDNISKNILDPVQNSKSVSPPVQNPSVVNPAPVSTPIQTTTPATAAYTIPTGTVVISAETLTEQQRMLEELNRQIEEQKRQLKEQEEALRQQREAVGMFMAQFSASDALMASPSAALPLNKQVTVQKAIPEVVKASTPECPVLETTSETSEKDTSASVLLEDKSETQETPKENEQNSSAGEVGDSDVAYDPEDESLFDEIQAGMLEKKRSNSQDSSVSKKDRSSSHSRRHKYSPKRKSNRERGRHRSPPSRSQRRSSSHSRRRKDRDRHHRSEENSSRHRSRDRSERRSRTQRDSASHSHSHRHRRSSSSHRNKHSVSLSPRKKREPSPDSQADAKNDTNDDATQPNMPDEKMVSSSDNLNDVNAEVKKLLTSMDVQDQAACNDNLPGDLKCLKWATELLMDGKLDSLIPLRELEPPTRDSPQSPDPEPQLDLKDFIKREIKTDPEIDEEKVKIESDSKSLKIPDITVFNDQKLLGLINKSAVSCVKIEPKSEDALFSENIVAKELAVEDPSTQNKGGYEENSCKDISLAFGECERDHKTSSFGSPGIETPDCNKTTLDRDKVETNIGQSESSSSSLTSNTENISSKSNKDNDSSEIKQMHGQQLSRHQMTEENHNVDNDSRNGREMENIGSKFGEGGRPGERKVPNIGPGVFPDGQNLSGSRFDMSFGGDFMGPTSRGEGFERRDSGSFSGPDRSHFEGSNCGGQRSEGNDFFTDHFQSDRSDFQHSWTNSGPGFRGRGSRGLPFGGSESHRGQHTGPPFGRGEEHRNIPMDGLGPQRGGFGGRGLVRGGPVDGPGLHRGGFGGLGFGRGGEIKDGPVGGPGSLREGFRGPNFERHGEHQDGQMDGPGPRRGGFGGPGFGRGREHLGGLVENPGLEEAGFDRPCPMEGPGPHRGGFGGPSFSRGGECRGPMDGPGPHRGGFGGPSFGRDGQQEEPSFDRECPMDGPGPHRGSFRAPGFGRGGEHRGPMDGSGPNRGGFGGPRGCEQRGGPMEGPGPQRDCFGGPGFVRLGEHGGPMDCPEHRRGGTEEPGFDRGGPMDGPGSHRGGFGRPGFGRGGEHRGGPMENLGHEGGHIEPLGGPMDGPGPHRGRFGGLRGGPMDRGANRGGFGGAGFSRGGEHRGPMDCPEHQRGGHEEPSFDREGPVDGPGPHRGAFRGRGFGRGGDRVQMDGQGQQRGGFGGPGFSRGGEHRGGFRGPGFGRGEGHKEPDFDRHGPMDGPGPHRGGFGGPGFGRGGEHRGGPIDAPGPCREGFRGPDFDSASPVDGPGPHRGGFGGPGFGRGGEYRGGPIDGPGPRREGFRGPNFDRGWDGDGQMKGPGTHHGEPGRASFDRGHEHEDAPMDSPGSYRGGFGGPGFGRRGPMDDSGPNRGRHRGPAFGRGGEKRGGPMDGPGQHRRGFGEPGFGGNSEQRGSPMECPGPLRGEYEGPGFDTVEDSGRLGGPEFRRRFRREGEPCDFPMEGPIGGPNFRGQGSNPRDRFRDGPMVDDNVENNRQTTVRNDPGRWGTGPQPLLIGLGPSRENNQTHGRPGPGGADFKPEGDFCGPGPSFRGLRNECGDPGNRGPGLPDPPFGGPRVDSENGRNMGDFRSPRPDHQRPGGMRSDNEQNEENRYRQDERADRPHHKQDRRSHERERSRSRDMTDDLHRPSQRRGSPSKEHHAWRKDHESGPKADSRDHKLGVHSPHNIEPKIKSPTSGESEAGLSTPVNATSELNAETEEEQVMPRMLKPALLPTPPEGPARPPFPTRGRGRGVLRR